MILEPKKTKVIKTIKIKTDPLLGKKVRVVQPADKVPEINLSVFECGLQNLGKEFTVASVTYHPYPIYPHFVAKVIEDKKLIFDTSWLEAQPL